MGSASKEKDVESLSESGKDSPTRSTYKSKSVLKSWVWKHYTKISEGKAECNYCKKLFVVSGTGTMSKHIRSKHSTMIPHTTQSSLDRSAKVGLPFKLGSASKGKDVESLSKSGKDSLTRSTFKSKSMLKSWVWKHYTKISEGKAECNYCKILFVVSGTGTMSKHIRAKHSTMITHTSPSTMDCSANAVHQFKFNAEIAHTAFIHFIVANNHAFTLGEEPNFQAFLSKLQPLYRPLSGTSVKDRVMKIYVQMRMKVIARLRNHNVALTTDIWTSPNKMAFVGITTSILDAKFNPMDIIIGFKHIIGDHSGIDIAEKFYETMKYYKLEDKMLAITTDNASSNETFIDHIVHLTKNNSRPFEKERWIRCFAHVMNLCVRSALECMFTLIEKLRSLVVTIRASPLRIEKFKEILLEGGVQLSDVEYDEAELLCAEGVIIDNDLLPIMDCPTRWSSTYFFLKRSLKMRTALDEIAKEQDLRKNKVQGNEWLILQEVFNFLKSFALITTYVEETSYPTLSLVVPMYNKLLNLLEDVTRDPSKHLLIRKGAAAGLDKLSYYYDKTSPIVMVATFLDPRCKLEYFVTHGWNYGGAMDDSFTPLDVDLISSRVKPAIEAMWKTYNSSSDSLMTIGGDPEEGTSSSKSKTDYSFIAEIISGSSKSTESETDELKQYENEETEASNSNPADVLSYWALKSRKWPRLSSMARDMLSIPATSAASERAFSKGKDVFGTAKMNLNSETLEALVCLRSWYRAGLLDEADVVSKNQLIELDFDNMDEY